MHISSIFNCKYADIIKETAKAILYECICSWIVIRLGNNAQPLKMFQIRMPLPSASGSLKTQSGLTGRGENMGSWPLLSAPPNALPAPPCVSSDDGIGNDNRENRIFVSWFSSIHCIQRFAVSILCEQRWLNWQWCQSTPSKACFGRLLDIRDKSDIRFLLQSTLSNVFRFPPWVSNADGIDNENRDNQFLFSWINPPHPMLVSVDTLPDRKKSADSYF